VHRTAWKRTLRRALAPLGLGVIAATSACSGASAGGAAAGPPPEASASARPAGPKARGDDLAQAKVFDARGQASTCAPPLRSCPETAPDRLFLDRCRLAGFQIRQCGCETRCTGDIATVYRHYDVAGHPKDCPPANNECSAPPASAAFQDACVEKGYRLDVCGCEWLCSGKFMK